MPRVNGLKVMTPISKRNTPEEKGRKAIIMHRKPVVSCTRMPMPTMPTMAPSTPSSSSCRSGPM